MDKSRWRIRMLISKQLICPLYVLHPACHSRQCSMLWQAGAAYTVQVGQCALNLHLPIMLRWTGRLHTISAAAVSFRVFNALRVLIPIHTTIWTICTMYICPIFRGSCVVMISIEVWHRKHSTSGIGSVLLCDSVHVRTSLMTVIYAVHMHTVNTSQYSIALHYTVGSGARSLWDR